MAVSGIEPATDILPDFVDSSKFRTTFLKSVLLFLNRNTAQHFYFCLGMLWIIKTVLGFSREKNLKNYFLKFGKFHLVTTLITFPCQKHPVLLIIRSILSVRTVSGFLNPKSDQISTSPFSRTREFQALKTLRIVSPDHPLS